MGEERGRTEDLHKGKVGQLPNGIDYGGVILVCN